MKKRKYEKRFCKMCGKESVFVSTESPEGYWVCTACGFRTSFGKYKMVINRFGIYFEDGGGGGKE